MSGRRAGGAHSTGGGAWAAPGGPLRASSACCSACRCRSPPPALPPSPQALFPDELPPQQPHAVYNVPAACAPHAAHTSSGHPKLGWPAGQSTRTGMRRGHGSSLASESASRGPGARGGGWLGRSERVAGGHTCRALAAGHGQPPCPPASKPAGGRRRTVVVAAAICCTGAPLLVRRRPQAPHGLLFCPGSGAVGAAGVEQQQGEDEGQQECGTQRRQHRDGSHWQWRRRARAGARSRLDTGAGGRHVARRVPRRLGLLLPAAATGLARQAHSRGGRRAAVWRPANAAINLL